MSDFRCEIGTREVVSHGNTGEPHVNHMGKTGEIKSYVKLEHRKCIKIMYKNLKNYI